MAKDLVEQIAFEARKSTSTLKRHVRNYTIGDVVARTRRQLGYAVLYPMGWDAFGLPAENAAIKAKVHPRTWTLQNIGHMREQFLRLGLSYDWSRELTTCEPEYFVHEQRIFMRCSSAGWPTARARWSTGAPSTRRCWPTSRSRTGCAGAAARWCSSASSSSGS